MIIPKTSITTKNLVFSIPQMTALSSSLAMTNSVFKFDSLKAGSIL